MTPARSIVKENFKEKRFMIKPNHTYKVNDIKLYINDKVDERFDENKVYGPYNSNDNIVVHLEGKIGKHTVKTNSERVGLPEGTEEYRTIELSLIVKKSINTKMNLMSLMTLVALIKMTKKRKIGTMATKVHLKIIKVKMMRIKKIILRKE